MRSLAQGVYTQEQVEAQLANPNARYGSTFEILDRDGRHILWLPEGDHGVELGATVEFNADADIRGQLRCRMRPIETLRGLPFQRLLKPWFVLVMPDGGSVQYPLGEYVWSSPDRDVAPGDEWWDVVVADKSHLLDLGGPGAAGFSAAQSSFLHTQVNRVLTAAGFEASCPAMDVRLTKNMFWGLTSPKKIRTWESQYRTALSKSTPVKGKARTAAQKKEYAKARSLAKKLARYVVEDAPTTWLGILYDMCNSAGYTFHFDYDGKPRVLPAKDLSAATPEFTFEASGVGTITSRVGTTTDYSSIANRVFVRRANDALLPLVVDANTVMPWHPLAESKVGVYIDTTIDQVTEVGSKTASAQGKTRLFASAGAYELVSWDALLHPGVEPFDVLGVRVPGDVEFDGPVPGHLRQHGFDLGAGLMTVEVSRVYNP